MAQPGTTCFWCNVDPRKEMPNGISPHSTWCPQYRPPKIVHSDGTTEIIAPIPCS